MTVAAPLPAAGLRARLSYPSGQEGRDQRFDFLRGYAMLSVIAAHLEMFSWFNFLFWERLGFVSAAELFVVASGLVLGVVNRRVSDREGLEQVTVRALRRAFVLYRAQLIVILLVMAIAAIGIADMTALTSFTDRWAGVTYTLTPDPGLPWMTQLGQAVLMQRSPHQIQILSLYVLLLAVSPLLLWLLRMRMLGIYFALTWALWFSELLAPPDRILLGMQFEFAFPLLGWQVLFTHALAVGFFRAEIGAWLAQRGRGNLAVAVSIILALGFLVLAQASPNPSFPSWARLPLIDPDTFYSLYGRYFLKDELPLPRLLNVAVFFVSLYALLTWFWVPLSRALGWLLIPIGEASLYVFLMHLLFIGLIDQLPGYFDGVPSFDAVWPGMIWVNTALYLATVLGLWLMVRTRFLFAIVPR
ncbi:OpgC domain-containing protein [Halodurantibacterium flavum]|uniref:OpgC domain-containing protein n=1 Tax=Halodurantibacterium flavum TaxID=1382802 RepID=A0ABW4S4Z8_9RHOB